MAAERPANPFQSELNSFDSNALRPTETRVTTRDGKRFVERKGDDGEVEVELVGTGEAFSLKGPAYGFDSESGEWAAQPPAEGDVINPTTLGELKVLTYNVWFAETNWQARCDLLLVQVMEEDPDIICFQEVTQRFLGQVLENEYIRENFVVSDHKGLSVYPYGVMVLSRLPVSRVWLSHLPTNMGRRVLLAELPLSIPGERFVVATVHLESMANTDMRIAQLEEIFPILDKYTHSVFCGDFNFGPEHQENESIQEGYLDVWPIVNPDDEGLTCGDRIDRVVVRDSGLLTPTAMVRLGVESANNNTLRASDHFGLSVTFSLNGGGAGADAAE